MRGGPLVLLLVGQSVAAQEIYRWESKDGQVHYTDDRSTIPRGAKVVTTEGAELGVVETGPAARPPPLAPPVPGRKGAAGIPAALYARLSQAETLASAGRASQAFEQLAEATSLAASDSDRSAIGASYGRIALERLGSGAREEAERFIRNGRELDPDVPLLRLASGELAWAAGDSQRAIDEWERGLRQAPDDRGLKRRLEEVRKRSHAFGGLGVSSSKWVTVTFDGAEDAAMAAYVVKTVEDARQAINELYGYAGEQRVEVILYPLRTFETAGPAHPSWAGGLYDGRIHLGTGGAAKQWGRLGETLLHEYGHRVLARTVGRPQHGRSKWPGWLDEGMAQLAPTSGTGGSIGCAHGHLAPLKSLEGGFFHLKEKVRESYFEAKHAVEVVIATYGRSSLPKLLRAMGEGATFEDAFRSATGASYSSFVEAFDKQAH